MPLLAIYSKQLKSGSEKSYVYTCVQSNLSYNSENVEATQAATDKWVSKVWCSVPVQHYSALEGKEVLRSTTTWTNLEDIMLNKISQAQKDKQRVIKLSYNDCTYMKYLESWDHRGRE